MSAPTARRATFIGIGAQKTASTWLHGVLGQLPGVAASQRKEVDFFSAFFDHGYEWYERHFRGGDAVHRGEVSPSYFIDADAPARAAAYHAGAKILVTLRDPVERAFSNHLHEVQRGHVSGANLTFETALHNNPLYLEQGLYARHLGRWLAHFAPEAVLVLYQDEIRANGRLMAEKLADFLGVPLRTPLVDRRANESVAYRNKALGQTLWRMGRMARRRGLGGAVERLKNTPGVRQLHGANRRSVRADIPPMTPAAERHLTEFFASDVAALGNLLGRPPPWPRWNANALAAHRTLLDDRQPVLAALLVDPRNDSDRHPAAPSLPVAPAPMIAGTRK